MSASVPISSVYAAAHTGGFSSLCSLCCCKGLWSALRSPPSGRGDSMSHGCTWFCKKHKKMGSKCLVWGERCSSKIHLFSRLVKGRSLSFQPVHMLLHRHVLLLKLPMSVPPLSASPAEKLKSLLRSKAHPAVTLPRQHASAPSR